MCTPSLTHWIVSYGDFDIAGVSLTPKARSRGDCLVMHGAGAANKERVLPLMQCFVSAGYSTHAFDAIGHGATGGTLQNTSLRDRSEQARCVIESLGLKRRLLLAGASMGGFTALDLATRYSINAKAIVLVAPAVYAEEAYNVDFGPDFSEVIRRPMSWMDAKLWHDVTTLIAPMLIFIGTSDDVIPQEVPDMLKSRSNSKHSAIVKLHRYPHQLSGSMSTDKELSQTICHSIQSFLAGIT